jgi:hypothetical protein
MADEAVGEICIWPERRLRRSPRDIFWAAHRIKEGGGGEGGRQRLDCADLGHGRTVDHIFYPLSPGCAWPISGRRVFYFFI